MSYRLQNINAVEIKNGVLKIKNLEEYKVNTKKIAAREIYPITIPYEKWRDMKRKTETPFMIRAKKFGIAKQIEEEDFYLKIGKKLEPQIIEILQKEQIINGDIKTQQEIDSPFFSGNIDCIVNNTIFEIKTIANQGLRGYFNNNQWTLFKDKNNQLIPSIKSKQKINDWVTGKKGDLRIPSRKTEYWYQVCTYLYATGLEKAYLVVYFYDNDEVLNDAKPRAKGLFQKDFGFDNIRILKIDTKDLNSALGREANKHDFKNTVEEAIEWYKNHIITGISPKMYKEDMVWLEEELNKKDIKK